MNHEGFRNNDASSRYEWDKRNQKEGNEPRELFPVVNFHATRFFHPSAINAGAAADFRPNVVAADAPDPGDEHKDCKYKCSPACWATASRPGVDPDPKGVDSSATDNATPSGVGGTGTGSSESPTTTQTKNDQASSSVSTESPASAVKVAMLIPPSVLPSTLGVLNGSPKEPVADSGSAEKQTQQTVTSSSQDADKQLTKQS